MEVTREAVREAYQNDQAATTVLLASRWLQTHPNDRGIILHYAEMLYKMTRYEDAIRVYENAIERLVGDESSHWAIFNQLGRMYEYWGRLAEAEPWYRKAIETEPDEVCSYVFLGSCQARQGKLKEAEETHRAATRWTESYLLAEATCNLGLVLRAQGRLGESADSFRKAVEIDPKYADAIEALEDVEKALALSAQYAEPQSGL